MMMLSEHFGSIKFTYKFILGGGGVGWGWRGADNDDAVNHLGSLNKFLLHFSLIYIFFFYLVPLTCVYVS